ncbi:MAG: hypothetical protein WD470_03245 [Rhodospirillaceae bacterium]
MSQKPALRLDVEMQPIDSLVPCARNAWRGPRKQIARTAASIREFGFTNPVFIDAEGGVIAGVLVARHLGLGEVPAARIAHIPKARRRAVRRAMTPGPVANCAITPPGTDFVRRERP